MLSRLGVRQDIDEFESLRNKQLRGSIRRHEGNDLSRGWFFFNCESKGSADSLAQRAIGHADDGGVRDVRMSEEKFLDLSGADFFSSPVNHVFDSSRDRHVSRAVEPGEIAGPKKTVGGESSLVLLWIFQIAGKDSRSPRRQLAVDVRWQRPARVVENPEFVIGTDRFSHRAADRLEVIVESGAAERPFAHTEFGNVVSMESLADALDEIGRGGLAAGRYFSERAEIVIVNTREFQDPLE